MLEQLMDARDLEVLAWRLFEESNDAIFLLDAETERIWQANPTAQRLTGLRWRALRGRCLQDVIHSSSDDQIKRLLSAVRQTGFFHSQEEYLLQRCDTQPLPINVSVSRVHAPSGQVGLVVARDISDRKRAEATVRKFNEQLQAQVKLQTEQLSRANEELVQQICTRETAQQELRQANTRLREVIGQLERAREQAIRRERLHALEQIAGGVAHDINNSLSGVAAYSALILGKDLDSETRGWAEGIRITAGDIAGIVRRLRQFYGDAQEQHDHESIDVVSLVQEAVQLSKPKWLDESLRRRKAITLSIREEAAPLIVGDPSALRSVLSNLIFNAVDAIAGQGQITLRIAKRDSQAVIEVSDNGEGMSSEQQRRCLEPFYTTKSEGTGLGLSVCHGIVKAHGGQIEIESTAAVGSTIRLLMPIPKLTRATACDATDSGLMDSSGASLLEGKTVLYVDDHQAARQSTAALLASLGLTVDTAEDGSSGLAMFLERSYDILITDMTMPGMDGLQLSSEIKRINPDFPVLVISGWLTIDVDNDPQTGPNNILGKPLDGDELAVKLTDLLRDCSPPGGAEMKADRVCSRTKLG